MNLLLRFFLLAASSICLAACSGYQYADRAVKARDRLPIAAYSTEQLKLARSLGIALGKSYGRTRAALIADGWQPDFNHAKEMASQGEPGYNGFSELWCGSGWDAICTSVFIRSGQIVSLTINPRPGGSPVEAVCMGEQCL